MTKTNTPIDSKFDYLAFPYNPHKTNQISAWYDATVAGSADVKRQLVEQSPDLAYRVAMIFHDKELSEIFIERYKFDEGRNSMAYFLSESLGRPITRIRKTEPAQHTEIDPEIERIIRDERRGGGFTGSSTPDPYWRNENVWDNGIKLIESR